MVTGLTDVGPEIDIRYAQWTSFLLPNVECDGYLQRVDDEFRAHR